MISRFSRDAPSPPTSGSHATTGTSPRRETYPRCCRSDAIRGGDAVRHGYPSIATITRPELPPARSEA
ncbi:MAG: hypothetical protein L0H39_06725, partial [Brachybacterium sp.]|nr:hypothetical protein [Brachybacterium sp.]